MKMARLFPAIIAAAAVTAMATQSMPVPKIEREAQCIVAGYTTYSATIVAVGPRAKTRPVTLRIDKVYAGSYKVGTRVVRDYTEPSAELESDARDAWQGVSARVGEKVLVIDRGDQRMIVGAEPDASPTAARIRELIELNKRAAGEPKLLVDRAASLQPNADLLETTFVIQSAAFRIAPDVAAEMLTALMKKDGFTPAQRMDLARNFGLVWFNGTAEGKARSIKQLALVAASRDLEKARFAVMQLMLIRSQAPTGLPPLSISLVQQIQSNYDKLVAQGHPRDAAFESFLKRPAGAR